MTITAPISIAAEPRASSDDEARWARCPSCAALVYLKRLDRHQRVCPECSYHWRIPVRQRLELLLDSESFSEWDAYLRPADPLSFHDSKPYPQRLANAQRSSGNIEAVVSGSGTIDGAPVVVAAVDFQFMGGSIGTVAGEKICRAADRARTTRTPLLLICASGGARMQEGVLSLMQMVRTSQVIAQLHEDGVLCVNLNTDPTYGGATASFASLGDIVLAEPGARIGFAGPQVIRQTIGQNLPAGFQTAEFLLENGLLDLIVPRDALRGTLSRILRLHAGNSGALDDSTDEPSSAPSLQRPAWEVVRQARDLGRPTTLDLCARVFDDFLELHGDRVSGDDPAVVGGLARLAGRAVVVIGHQKGHLPADLVRRTFGMPHPAGYHKAQRLMRYAAKFGCPVLTFVDTPGAFPDAEAERSGQGPVIAECIMRMSRLPVPTVTIVTGEGGSGGALALAVGNRVLMMRNSFYSVISPEGCSTILWGTAGEAAKAATALRITADDLYGLGVVDGILPEPPGGAPTDWDATAATIRRAFLRELATLSPMPATDLIRQRYERFESFGMAVQHLSSRPQ